jgi:hypothetical protein
MRRGQRAVRKKARKNRDGQTEAACHNTRAGEKIVRKSLTPGRLVIIASAIMLLMAPAWAQSGQTEQELLQIRQKMARSFAEAVKNKDGMQAADQYSKDYSRRAQLQSIQARRRRYT